MRSSGLDAKAGENGVRLSTPAIWSGSELHWLIIGIINKVIEYHGYNTLRKGSIILNQLLIAYLLFCTKFI